MEREMEGQGVRLRDAVGDVLSSQRYPLPDGLRGSSGRPAGLDSGTQRRRKGSRYDAAAASRQLFNAPAGPGWQRRLAELPTWDGVMRYRLSNGKTWTGTPEDVTEEARILLVDVVEGRIEGKIGREMRDDPNDPPMVTADILASARSRYWTAADIEAAKERLRQTIEARARSRHHS